MKKRDELAETELVLSLQLVYILMGYPNTLCRALPKDTSNTTSTYVHLVRRLTKCCCCVCCRFRYCSMVQNYYASHDRDDRDDRDDNRSALRR